MLRDLKKKKKPGSILSSFPDWQNLIGSQLAKEEFGFCYVTPSTVGNIMSICEYCRESILEVNFEQRENSVIISISNSSF